MELNQERLKALRESEQVIFEVDAARCLKCNVAATGRPEIEELAKNHAGHPENVVFTVHITAPPRFASSRQFDLQTKYTQPS